MELNPEGVKVFLMCLVIAAVIGVCVGVLFSCISPLTGLVIGSAWAVATLLFLCCVYTGA